MPGSVRMKNLWIFDHYAVPPTRAGFSRQYEHAERLRELGWQTHIVASGFNHKTRVYDHPVHPTNPWYDSVEDEVLFRWVYTSPYYENNFRRYLNMITYAALAPWRLGQYPRPDIVMGVSPHLLAALVGWAMAKRYRIPFVFEVQDLWPESLIQLGMRNPIIIKLLRGLEGFLYQQADAIVSLTNGITTGVRSVIGSSDKVVLIPNGASALAPLSVNARAEMRCDLGWRDEFVAVWAGAHGPANHLETIVEAAHILHKQGRDDIRLALIGDGSEKDRLIRLGAEFPNLQFLDPVKKQDLGAILQSADAGLIVHSNTLAVRGARPTKLTEYMSARLPIISNLEGECARLIEQGQCGVTVDSESPGQLAAALIHASEHRTDYRDLGENGLEFMKATHDRQDLAASLADLLDRLTN